MSSSASGAVASVSIGQVDGEQLASKFGTITQTSKNNDHNDANGAKIINAASSVTVGAVHGHGATLSVTAMGAVTAVSGTSINGSMGTITTGTVTQTVTNATGSTISNTASISLASGITGNGASASIPAIGAGGVVSLTAMK